MKTIYLVLPCYNEELVIEDSIKKLKSFMQQLMKEEKVSGDSRVVFVNDGSADCTWELIEKACKEDALFGGISLAGNRGHQNAILAGMIEVKDLCDAVITLDADLQHDITVIPEFIRQFEAGNEIVYGVRKSRDGESWFKKTTGDMFYNVMSSFGTKIIKNHADYRLMSSRAIEELSHFQEVNLFLRGIVPLIGFQSTVVEYDEKPRMAGESKYSLKKMLALALNGITSFSVRPLQMITLGGVFCFLGSIIMFIYAVVMFFRNGTVPGWASIVAPIWLLGGMQLLALGVVGEYVGKIYMETKHRPQYIIDSKIL